MPEVGPVVGENLLPVGLCEKRLNAVLFVLRGVAENPNLVLKLADPLDAERFDVSPDGV